MKELYLWSEIFRPKTISECILPDRIKGYFQAMVDKGELQNMLLVGSPGSGKTTAARALCNELDIDNILLNCSENGNIDMIRTTLRSFASTVSFNGGKIKCVILDESDYLSTAAQPALRGFIEEFSSNCRFIFTANYGNRIIDPLKSRLAVIDFNFTKDEKKILVVEFFKRVKMILEDREVKYEKQSLVSVIQKYFPDFRKVLNEMQRFSQTGSLEVASLTAFSDEAIASLVQGLKDKKFSEVRKWVAENPDFDFGIVQKALYTRMYDLIDSGSIPQLVLTLAEYDYKNSFCMDKEINLVAMLISIMSDVNFK